MICYRDMTWCTFLDCKDKKCSRRYTDKVKAEAKAWWGGKGAPICRFVNKPDCFKGKGKKK